MKKITLLLATIALLMSTKFANAQIKYEDLFRETDSLLTNTKVLSEEDKIELWNILNGFKKHYYTPNDKDSFQLFLVNIKSIKVMEIDYKAIRQGKYVAMLSATESKDVRVNASTLISILCDIARKKQRSELNMEPVPQTQPVQYDDWENAWKIQVAILYEKFPKLNMFHTENGKVYFNQTHEEVSGSTVDDMMFRAIDYHTDPAKFKQNLESIPVSTTQ